MTQWAIASPTAIFNQGYTNQDGAATAGLMNAIDKLSGNVSPAPFINDNSHIKCPNTIGDHVVVGKLVTASIYDLNAPPLSVTTGFIVTARFRKDLASGGMVNAVVELRQDYINESTLGILICQIQQTDVTPTFTAFTHTLTSGEIALITNYANLFVRIVGSSL